MRSIQARDKRNVQPTPEAVFAMYHWHDAYATQNGGAMDFWDSLSDQQKDFCQRAVVAIREAK